MDKYEFMEFVEEYQHTGGECLNNMVVLSKSKDKEILRFKQEYTLLNNLYTGIIKKNKDKDNIDDIKEAFWICLHTVISNFNLENMQDRSKTYFWIKKRLEFEVKEYLIKQKEELSIINDTYTSENGEEYHISNIVSFNNFLSQDEQNDVKDFLSKNNIKDILTNSQYEIYKLIITYNKDYKKISQDLNKQPRYIASQWDKIQEKLYKHYYAFKQVKNMNISATYDIKQLLDTINNFSIFYDIEDDLCHYNIIIQFLKKKFKGNDDFFKIDYEELQSNKRETGINVPYILEEKLNMADFNLIVKAVKDDPLTDDEKRKIVRKVNASLTKYLQEDKQARMKYIEFEHKQDKKIKQIEESIQRA